MKTLERWLNWINHHLGAIGAVLTTISGLVAIYLALKSEI